MEGWRSEGTASRELQVPWPRAERGTLSHPPMLSKSIPKDFTIALYEKQLSRPDTSGNLIHLYSGHVEKVSCCVKDQLRRDLIMIVVTYREALEVQEFSLHAQPGRFRMRDAFLSDKSCEDSVNCD